MRETGELRFGSILQHIVCHLLSGVAVILLLYTGVLGQPLPGQLQTADSLRNAGAFTAALDTLQKLERTYPKRADVLWRMAYTRMEMGERMRPESVQAEYYDWALQEAKRAIAIDSTDSFAWAVQAMAAARAARVASSTQRKIELSRLVKESADRAIRLDPENDIAFHVRARWHAEMASLSFFSRTVARLVYGGLPEASYDRAIENFQRAISIHDRIPHHFFMAQTYQEMGETNKALRHWKQVLQMPAETLDDREFKEEARALLETYG